MTSAAKKSPHNLPPEEVVSTLGSSADFGLTRSDAGDRLDRYGRNELPSHPPPHPIKLLIGQFRSLLVLILLLAAALNLIVWAVEKDQNLPYDTIVILAIVVANAILGFFQEYRAELSLEKLKALSKPLAIVIRDGRQMDIASSELVPGDVIVLTTGKSVLADARLTQAKSLEANESLLTGESTAVHKSEAAVAEDTPLADRTCMVYAGTSISAGKGLAVVTATGSSTEIGAIAELIHAAERPQTPLQKNLSQLGRRLGLLVIIIAAVVSTTGLLLGGPVDSASILNILLFGVALAVAAIPEGLPAIVTVALSLGTQRMARRRAIVRKLASVETLGSTTAICSDKTGTLTVGEMTVREILLPDGRVTIGGAGYIPEGKISGPPKAQQAAGALAVSSVLCNDASISEENEGRWRALGTPTEAAFVAMAVKLGVDYTFLRQKNRRLSEAPFSSERKMMSVIVSAGGGGGMLHAKGAPEILLPKCTQVARGGVIAQLSDDDRKRFLKEAEQMAARALRTLAIANRVVEPGACAEASECEEDLVFLGLAGISDPPRPEAKKSVQLCRQAGIDVFMLTGDHLTTAEVIATELGIKGQSMSGSEIERDSDEDLRRRVKEVRIFARVKPAHKVRLVSALQANGHTVAVTGDGVNDAPALKTADIGVAMGLGGTDVAREAADMVLADDNFATIEAAVEEGRSIYTNIRKFVGNLLSSNAGEIITLFFGVLLAGMLGLYEDGRLLLPLLAVQILWINLVTDGLPALALGVDPKEPGAMSQPPRPRDEPIVNYHLWGFIGLVGAVSGVITLLMLDAYSPGGMFTLFAGHDLAYARTIAFVTLAVLEMYNTFNFRRIHTSSLRHLLGNRWLLAATSLSIVLMVAVVHVPTLQTAFNTVPLAPVDWLLAALMGSSVLWVGEIYKAAGRAVTQAADNIPLR